MHPLFGEIIPNPYVGGGGFALAIIALVILTGILMQARKADKLSENMLFKIVGIFSCICAILGIMAIAINNEIALAGFALVSGIAGYVFGKDVSR